MSRWCVIRVVLGVFSVILVATPASSQVVATRDVDYRAEVDFENGKDRLDIYMPEGAEMAPVIVFFHGGALRAGSKGRDGLAQ